MENLTPKQREIVALVAEGLSNKEIARLLQLSEGTVKSHLDRTFRKLGVEGAGCRVFVVLHHLHALAPRERDAFLREHAPC